MTNAATLAPATTDWNTVSFAALAARPYPSLDRPTYNPTGHATATCPAIQGKIIATDASLADHLERNEWFDGEVAFLDVWPCGTCVSVKGGKAATIGFEAPLPAFGAGTGTARPAVETEADPREEEARTYAAAYTGTFQFMVDMKAKAQRPAARLTPNMVSAILRCKAADASRAAAPATVAPSAPQTDEDARRAGLRANAYAGTCRSCKGEVAADAGKREQVAGRWTVLHATTGECSATPAAAVEAPAAPLPTVPDGKYAVTADAGHLSFYEVRTPTEGKWAGYVFVDLLIGSPGTWRHQKVSRDQRPAVMAKIAADPQGAAALYGLKFEQCGQCGSPLSHERSRKAGYGQTCAGKNGWAW